MEFRILGPAEALIGSESVPLDGSKLRTVLVSLLFADGRSLPDRRMSYLLWGDKPPTTPNAQIYTYVSRLRGRLQRGGLEILRQGTGYSLEGGSWNLDYRRFGRLAEVGLKELRNGDYDKAAQDLKRALDLWRGPALCDVTPYLSDAELPGMEEARHLAQENYIDARLVLGQHRELVSDLTRLVKQHPLRERLRAQFMIALYRCGRASDALLAYQEVRQILAHDLGIAPGEVLQRTHHAVLASEFAPGSFSWEVPAWGS